MELRKHLLKSIDASKFYANELDYDGYNKVKCPFHEEEKPSFDVRGDGSCVCYGCGKKFRNVLEFYAGYHEITYNKAVFELFHQYIEPLIPRTVVQRQHERLKRYSTPYRYLTKRGIGVDTMRKFLIGWDNERITLPVFNEWGFCVNIRRLSYKEETPKILSYKKGYGKPRLFPLTAFTQSTIFLFEGETDMLLASHNGLNAVTLTGGAMSWKSTHTPLFRNKHVYICYDNDDSGRVGAKLAASDIASVATTTKIIDIPKEMGKDFSNYMDKRPILAFYSLVEKAKIFRSAYKEKKSDLDFFPEKNMIVEIKPKKQMIHIMIKVLPDE